MAWPGPAWRRCAERRELWCDRFQRQWRCGPVDPGAGGGAVAAPTGLRNGALVFLKPGAATGAAERALRAVLRGGHTHSPGVQRGGMAGPLIATAIAAVMGRVSVRFYGEAL
eukprot:gene28004-27628_t